MNTKAEAGCPCWSCGHRGNGYIPGWPTTSGPQHAINKRDGDEYPQRPRWVDHSYRFTSKTGGTIYCAEPYYLDAPDLADLVFLEAQGYDVRIDGEGMHHPGTIRIEIQLKISTHRALATEPGFSSTR
jgi:hypothetical protein